MLDFRRLNRDLPAREIVRALGLKGHIARANEWRGPCPIHNSKARSSRCFDLDLALNRWHCHKCSATGDLIDLWALLRGLSVYDAAWQLARLHGICVNRE